MSIIHLIDDSATMLMSMEMLLKRAGYTVTKSNSAEAAIKDLEEITPKLIITDLNMPGMNGYETTQAIRIFDKHIPIIALTAAEASFITKTAQNSGMNDIVTKPYNVDDLSSTISKHVQIRNLIASF